MPPSTHGAGSRRRRRRGRRRQLPDVPNADQRPRAVRHARRAAVRGRRADRSTATATASCLRQRPRARAGRRGRGQRPACSRARRQRDPSRQGVRRHDRQRPRLHPNGRDNCVERAERDQADLDQRRTRRRLRPDAARARQRPRCAGRHRRRVPDTYATLQRVPGARPTNGDGDGLDDSDACPFEAALHANGCPLPALTALSGKVKQARARQALRREGESARAGRDAADPRAAQGGQALGQGEAAHPRHDRQPGHAQGDQRLSAGGTASSWPSPAAPAPARRHPGLPRPVDIRGCPPAASASSPSATRSRTAVASSSGASRCSRGRCGSRAGSALPYTASRSTARRVRDVLGRAGAARRAEGARYDLGCLYVGANDVRRPDWDRAAFERDHRAALAFLAERCDRVLTADRPARPRPPARRRRGARGERRDRGIGAPATARSCSTCATSAPATS